MTLGGIEEAIQAKGDVVPLPVAEEQAPPDFAAFFAEEHRGLYKALCFVTGNRAERPS